MIPVQIKIYGAFSPVAPGVAQRVAPVGDGAVGQTDPWIFQEGDLLRISFEGVWFPWEDLPGALAEHLGQDARGKLDVLDLDAWTLIRYTLDEHGFHRGVRPLNQVLDYSGH